MTEQRRSSPRPKLTAQEVGDMLCLRPAYVLDLARRGAIPHVRIGKYVRFDEQAVSAWWDAGCPATEPRTRGLHAA